MTDLEVMVSMIKDGYGTKDYMMSSGGNDEWDNISDEWDSREEWAESQSEFNLEAGNPAHFFYNPRKLTGSEWLIHFTDGDPKTIIKEGFKGVDPYYAGLTRGGVMKQGGGDIGFAFEVGDYYSFGKYGDNAVIFQAKNAYKAHHCGDEESQVIFDTNSMHNLYPVYKYDNSSFMLHDNNGEELLFSDRFELQEILKSLKPTALGAKQVGTIYHHTSYARALCILRDNKIVASSGEAGTKGGYISTTRNKRFLGDSRHGLGGVGVVFVLDGDKLSDRYEIVPWKYSAGIDASDVGDEDEERIIGITSVPNIKSYIQEVKVYETYITPSSKDYDIIRSRFMNDKKWTAEEYKDKVESYGVSCSIIPKGKVWANLKTPPKIKEVDVKESTESLAQKIAAVMLAPNLPEVKPGQLSIPDDSYMANNPGAKTNFHAYLPEGSVLYDVMSGSRNKILRLPKDFKAAAWLTEPMILELDKKYRVREVTKVNGYYFLTLSPA